jgi:hypothetical protein
MNAAQRQKGRKMKDESQQAVEMAQAILRGIEGQPEHKINEKMLKYGVMGVFDLSAEYVDAIVLILIKIGYIKRSGDNLKSLRIA